MPSVSEIRDNWLLLYETYGDKFYDFSLFTTLGECVIDGGSEH